MEAFWHQGANVLAHGSSLFPYPPVPPSGSPENWGLRIGVRGSGVASPVGHSGPQCGHHAVARDQPSSPSATCSEGI